MLDPVPLHFYICAIGAGAHFWIGLGEVLSCASVTDDRPPSQYSVACLCFQKQLCKIIPAAVLFRVGVSYHHPLL